jgi:hypothetical protein
MISFQEAAVSLQLYPASIAETCASEGDSLGTPRLSSRLSLLFLIGASALGYGLAYQALSLSWRALTGA